MSKKVLVTGVTGTGKSTLRSIFAEKGYQTEDIDKGFAEWRNRETGEPQEYQDDPKWHELVDWDLKVDELKTRLNSVEDKPIIVFGSTNDLFDHLDLFTSVRLLEYPDESSLIHRLATRPEGQYGKKVHEKDAALAYYKDYQEKMKKMEAVPINCTLSLEEISEIIEAEVQGE